MKSAVAAANQLNEAQLKTLIKKFGTASQIPKKRSPKKTESEMSSVEESQEQLRRDKAVTKIEFISSLVEILRSDYENVV